MAVFIRNRRTGRLYQGYNRWVTDARQAFDFELAPRAVHWIDTVHLTEAEVVRSSGGRVRRITVALRIDDASLSMRAKPGPLTLGSDDAVNGL